MERFGICNLSAIPVRAEASERSEMVNQLLFGETFAIVNSYQSWKVIRGSLDNYEGFIDEKQFRQLDETEFMRLKGLPALFPVGRINEIVDENTGLPLIIFPGSNLAGIENGILKLGGKSYRFYGETFTPSKAFDCESLVETAKLFLNSPYFWGGRSPFGIDCSGLVQVVFKVHGVHLNRDASFQAQQGETINLYSEAETGDLLFFDNEESRIIHVGIMVESGKIIHSSGQVRIDQIDHHGIFNDELQKYTHKLRLIKRVNPK
jgi:hypothetical protein